MQDAVFTDQGWQADPMRQFQVWFSAMLEAKLPEPYTMQLATANASGHPSVRTVYLRGDPTQGLTFYTNLHSQKAQELEENPWAEMLFYWPQLGQQVRASGTVTRVSPEQADSAFHQQPHQIQVAAHINGHQSRPMKLEELSSRLDEVSQQFPEGTAVARPEYWSGFRLNASRWEFWQGRPDGLHDRFAYVLEQDCWAVDRLTP
ncbi:pyridoxamine 5'-phosphate oxidase [Deinococcus radiopugnans ATCC 19172]|nr:pyridoxamine 5'-phosphate oxidase [Deinococcus radiopugnans ATCC 19172]